MAHAARACEMCGRPLPWSKRGDARYCDAACRLRAHRERARMPKRPVEISRTSLHDNEFGEEVLVRLSERFRRRSVLFEIEYAGDVPCDAPSCERTGPWALAVCRKARGSVPYGPPVALFCGEACLLDAVYARRGSG